MYIQLTSPQQTPNCHHFCPKAFVLLQEASPRSASEPRKPGPFLEDQAFRLWLVGCQAFPGKAALSWEGKSFASFFQFVFATFEVFVALFWWRVTTFWWGPSFQTKLKANSWFFCAAKGAFIFLVLLWWLSWINKKKLLPLIQRPTQTYRQAFWPSSAVKTPWNLFSSSLCSCGSQLSKKNSLRVKNEASKKPLQQHASNSIYAKHATTSSLKTSASNNFPTKLIAEVFWSLSVPRLNHLVLEPFGKTGSSGKTGRRIWCDLTVWPKLKILSVHHPMPLHMFSKSLIWICLISFEWIPSWVANQQGLWPSPTGNVHWFPWTMTTTSSEIFTQTTWRSLLQLHLLESQTSLPFLTPQLCTSVLDVGRLMRT